MPYVVTQSCCADASCVYACPVNCIHPTPDEPDFGTAEMLHVDPSSCVECGACVSACPVDAIKPHERLSAAETPFLQINADFYTRPRPRPVLARPVPAAALDPECGPVRVAIVGSGPAAMYAADELLTQPDVRVDVYERLERPYGLARFGVAPDHARTRRVSDLFDLVAAQPGFTLHTGVEVGTDLRHEDLVARHDAVIYAVGAATDRRLGIPGEDRPGCRSATDFVAWYNDHPEHADDHYALDGLRAVVIGNGNVALDVARILTRDPETLVGTGISAPALTALRSSAIDEVVVAARRGPAESAFTVPELVGLISTPGVEVVVDAPGGMDAPGGGPADGSADGSADGTEDPARRIVAAKLALLRSLPSADAPRRLPRRIVLRYRSAPVEVVGDDRVRGLALVRTEPVREPDGRVGARAAGPVEVLDTALVLTSVGYRGVPVPGLPFDPVTGTVPNVAGRVIDADGVAVPRTYVTGWIKRGPTGFLGTNKSDAQQTVAALVADVNAARRTPVPSA